MSVQKWLAVVFAVMTLVFVPVMAIARAGSRIAASDLDIFGFGRVSIGNIGTCRVYVT